GWTSLFEGSKLATKGKSLNFTSLIVVHGKPQARLSQAELKEGNSKWECSTIVYALGDTPTIASLGRFVEREWNFVSKPQIFLYDEGYFVIKFAFKEDRDKAVFVGLYSFFRISMLVKKWKVDFTFQKEALKVVPLWVFFLNLLLNF
ncbi:Chlorophenol O-methyltransferase, partial [Bienertia sinuspersici]